MAPGLSGHPEPSTQEDMQLPGTCTRRQRTLSKSWWLKEAGEDGGTADHNCRQLLMGGERWPKQTHAYQPKNPGDTTQICWATSLVLLFIAKILFRPPGYTSWYTHICGCERVNVSEIIVAFKLNHLPSYNILHWALCYYAAILYPTQSDLEKEIYSISVEVYYLHARNTQLRKLKLLWTFAKTFLKLWMKESWRKKLAFWLNSYTAQKETCPFEFVWKCSSFWGKS